MALNIKSDEAHRLAKRLADAQGTTLTEAVTSALRRQVDVVETESSHEDRLLAEIANLQRFVADLPDRDSRSSDEILGYDARGLSG